MQHPNELSVDTAELAWSLSSDVVQVLDDVLLAQVVGAQSIDAEGPNGGWLTSNGPNGGWSTS